MPTIVLDARKYFDFGIGTYIQYLIPELARVGSAHKWILFVAAEEEERVPAPPGWEKKVAPFAKYSVAEILRMAQLAKGVGFDLFHEPHYTLPTGLRRRSVVTVHDLIHLHFPRYFNRQQRLYARFMVRHAVKHAGRVVTDSRFVKDDLHRLFRVKDEKVRVVYPGIGGEFRPAEDTKALAEFRTRFELERPYVLFVGSTKPHKNVPVLMKAVAELRERRPDLLLVFAGEPLTKVQKMFAEMLGLNPHVRSLGRLSTAGLVLAYQGASAVAVPSLHEGFGFPAVEAMACGIPVVASNAGSLPEVTGGAALVVEADQPGAFAEALGAILDRPEIRNDLVAKGLVRAKEFSWHRAAEEMLRVYESVLAHRQKDGNGQKNAKT